MWVVADLTQQKLDPPNEAITIVAKPFKDAKPRLKMRSDAEAAIDSKASFQI